MKRKLILLIILLLASMLGACSYVPAQQLSDARQAVRAAADAGAPLYAPQPYGEALQLLQDADSFIEKGRYDLAGKVADRAKVLAIKARKIAVETGTGVEERIKK